MRAVAVVEGETGLPPETHREPVVGQVSNGGTDKCPTPSRPPRHPRRRSPRAARRRAISRPGA